MKYGLFTRSTDGTADRKLGRRGLIAGAGVAGLTVVALQALGRGRAGGPIATAAKGPPARQAHYRATPHVLRYYETAKS